MLKIFTLALIFALLAACDDIRQENYPSGKIRIQTQYVNDKKNGQQIEFYESGAKKSEKTFVDGKEQGMATNTMNPEQSKQTFPMKKEPFKEQRPVITKTGKSSPLLCTKKEW